MVDVLHMVDTKVEEVEDEGDGHPKNIPAHHYVLEAEVIPETRNSENPIEAPHAPQDTGSPCMRFDTLYTI